MTPDVASFALIALGLVLLIAAKATARPPLVQPPSTRDERARMWQQLHGAGDVDPMANPLVRWFLDFTHAIARPIAKAGVSPDLLTLVGLWIAAWSTVVGWRQGRWCVAAALVLIISALTDGVDGAVAGFTGRSSTHGFVLDSVVDRVSEVLFFAAVALAGGSPSTAVVGMGSVMLLEYTRARTTAAPGHQPGLGIVTVGERPTRVIGLAITLVAMGVAPQSAGFIGTWGPVVVAVATTVGWLQFCWSFVR